jgi:hypothetical protein
LFYGDQSINQKHVNLIKLILIYNLSNSKNNLPTCDLRDQGVDTKDANNFRAPYILISGIDRCKRRLIDVFHNTNELR